MTGMKKKAATQGKQRRDSTMNKQKNRIDCFSAMFLVFCFLASLFPCAAPLRTVFCFLVQLRFESLDERKVIEFWWLLLN